MEEKRRRRAARDRPSRTNTRFGWRHRFAPPEVCVQDGVNNVLLWCEYIAAIAPSAYQGRFVMPTGPLSSVDAWGGAWEAV